MSIEQVNPFLQVARAKTAYSASADGASVLPRVSGYGEQFVQPLHGKLQALADEGSYFLDRNPTPGTGLATIAAPTALDDTKPFILLMNQAAATLSPSRRIYLDYLKLIVTAAGTAGASINVSVKIDAAGVDRYTSGGSAITPVNPNMDSSATTNARVHAGALVTTAANGARLVGHQLIRKVIPVVGDTYYLNFGAPTGPVGGSASDGTAAAQLTFPMPPVIIGPGQQALIHLWLPSQSAASSYEVELGFWER